MKTSIISSAVLVTGIALSSCNQNKQSTYLSGELKGAEGKTIYLDQLNSQSSVPIDSAVVDEKGRFAFSKFKPSLNFYRLRVSPQNFSILILDSTHHVTYQGDIKNMSEAQIKGSEETTVFNELNTVSKKYKMRVDSLQQAFQSEIMKNSQDTVHINQLRENADKTYQSIIEQWGDAMAQKAKQYKDKFATIIALQMLDPQKYPDIYEDVGKALYQKYPQHPIVQMLYKMISQQSALSPGSICPDIALPNPDGKEIRLSSFRGKVVLIDFWASWCKPCRQDMPKLVALYKKYKDKGFEIYGVSLDKNKNEWIEAIKKDGIIWPQVSDLKFWNSDVVSLFNINAIPYTILIDKDGKILAKGLRGEELEKKLKEVLAI